MITSDDVQRLLDEAAAKRRAKRRRQLLNSLALLFLVGLAGFWFYLGFRTGRQLPAESVPTATRAE